MLIALITILFLGSSGDSAVLDYIADTRKSVKTVIVDDERRKEVTSTLKTMKNRTSGRAKSARQVAKQLKSALAEHDASEANINAAWDDYFAMTDAYNNDMIDLRFELKEQLSREEWQELFSQPEE
jgi:hypothetical protein